jgi:hypothetical protein
MTERFDERWRRVTRNCHTGRPPINIHDWSTSLLTMRECRRHEHNNQRLHTRRPDAQRRSARKLCAIPAQPTTDYYSLARTELVVGEFHLISLIIRRPRYSSIKTPNPVRLCGLFLQPTAVETRHVAAAAPTRVWNSWPSAAYIRDVFNWQADLSVWQAAVQAWHEISWNGIQQAEAPGSRFIRASAAACVEQLAYSMGRVTINSLPTIKETVVQGIPSRLAKHHVACQQVVVVMTSQDLAETDQKRMKLNRCR